jgi:hypothetical protein
LLRSKPSFRPLTKIKLPTTYEDDEPNESDADFLTSIPAQTIAGTTTTPAIENGTVINFARRPQAWQHGDIIEVFHHPNNGHTKLTATEDDRFIYSWKSESIAGRFQLERIDDNNYRVVQERSD